MPGPIASRIRTTPPPPFARNPPTYFLSVETRILVARGWFSLSREIAVGGLEQLDGHKSGRGMLLLLEPSGSLKYDGDLRFANWEMSD